MITPKLEKLIWEGRAFFKTYIAGPQKSTLNIENDRFIIITDITYSGYDSGFGLGSNFYNMQLAIYGEKGFNHYIFRNKNLNFMPVYNGASIDYVKYETNPGPQKIDTYLLHTTQVGFSFMGNDQLTNTSTAIFQEINPAYNTPLEYGKEGDTAAIPQTIAATDTFGIMNMQFMNRRDFAGLAGNVSSMQIQFPADIQTIPFSTTKEYCFAVVNYVEILGQPDNLEF